MKNIFIQGIGALAFIILMASYHQNNKKRILLLQMFSSLAFATHYYLLNGITATYSNLFCIFMFLIIYIFDNKKYETKSVLVVLLIPVLTIITILTWENVYSLLPIIATVLALISFIFDSETFIRIVGLVTSACWIIYGFIYSSHVSVIFNFINIISTSIAIIRKRKSILMSDSEKVGN